MEYRMLGRTGVQVTSLCLGTMNFGGSTNEEDSIAIINRSLDGGINFFDTADIYGFGHSENLLARALGNKNSGNLVIATKYGVRRTSTGKIIKDISDVWLEEALHGSLKRLKID